MHVKKKELEKRKKKGERRWTGRDLNPDSCVSQTDALPTAPKVSATTIVSIDLYEPLNRNNNVKMKKIDMFDLITILL